MRISDWSSDVCSSDLRVGDRAGAAIVLQHLVRPGIREAGEQVGGAVAEIGDEMAVELDQERGATLGDQVAGAAQGVDLVALDVDLRQVRRHLLAPEDRIQSQDRKSTRLNSSH